MDFNSLSPIILNYIHTYYGLFYHRKKKVLFLYFILYNYFELMDLVFPNF